MIRSTGRGLINLKDHQWKWLHDIKAIVDVSEYSDAPYDMITEKAKEHKVCVRLHWGRKPIFTRG
jgi:hypothetical protein